MVERAIQEVLMEVNTQLQQQYDIASAAAEEDRKRREEEETRKKAAAEADETTEQTTETPDNNNTPLPTEKSSTPLEPTLAERDRTAAPLFMDVFQPSRNDDDDPETKKDTSYPISGPARGVPDEWDLAAHKTTKRIMLRQCMRHVATHLLLPHGRQFYLDGPKGVGKSAALNALVIAARRSGRVVLFLPDGDVMTQRGVYVEPSPTREGVFDLPVMAQRLNEQLMVVHGAQLTGLTAERADLEEVFTPKQLKAVVESFRKEEGGDATGSSIPLVHVLRKGIEEAKLATGAYRTAIKTLTSDPNLRFLMVVDEINTYHDGGQYYHEKYDFHVQKPIPPRLISLFDPFLNPHNYNNISLITAPTHSRSISPKVTTQLSNEMANDDNVTVVNVPRYSDVEARAMIAHYESTGIGRLRFDRGDVLGDDQEVEYIKMVSGRRGDIFLRECLL
jgi:small subunit ribosomal protein S29